MKCHSNLVIGMSDSVFLRKAVDMQLDTVKPALSLMKSWNYNKVKCHMKAGTPLYTMIYYSGHTALDTTTPKRTHRCTSNKNDIYIYIYIYTQTYIHTHIYIMHTYIPGSYQTLTTQVPIVQVILGPQLERPSFLHFSAKDPCKLHP
jgi:hypothetical protein